MWHTRSSCMKFMLWNAAEQFVTRDQVSVLISELMFQENHNEGRSTSEVSPRQPHRLYRRGPRRPLTGHYSRTPAPRLWTSDCDHGPSWSPWLPVPPQESDRRWRGVAPCWRHGWGFGGPSLGYSSYGRKGTLRVPYRTPGKDFNTNDVKTISTLNQKKIKWSSDHTKRGKIKGRCAHLNPWLSQFFVWLRYLLSSVVGQAERPFLWGSPRVDSLKGWWRLGMFMTWRSLTSHRGLKAAGMTPHISSSHLTH